MKLQTLLPSLACSAALLVSAGCGDGDDASMDVPAAPVAQPQAAPQVEVTPAVAAPPVAAPPTGSAPAAMEPAAPDLFNNYKVSVDGGPNKTDVQALQAIVDGYAFGPDGLGAPPLKTLDDLVTSGYLKRLPPAPQGMKWAYDPPKWKVSVVPK